MNTFIYMTAVFGPLIILDAAIVWAVNTTKGPQ